MTGFRASVIASRQGFAFSVLDAGLYRFALGAISVLIATKTTPQFLGFYTTCMIALSVQSGITEGALRLQDLRFTKNRILSGYSLRFGLLGAVVVSLIVASFGWLFYLNTGMDSKEAVGTIWPLMLAPFATSLSGYQVRRHQMSGHWKTVLTWRIIGLVISFLAVIPFYFTNPDPVLISSFTLIADSVLFLGLIKQPTEYVSEPSVSHDIQNFRAKLLKSMRVQVASWLRLQTDRLVVAAVTSPHIAGLYFLSSSLGKVVSETLNTGGNSYLIAEVSKLPDPQKVRRQVSNNVTFTQVANVLIYSLTCVFALWFANEHQAWHELVKLVPLVSLSVFPIALFQAVWAASFVVRGSEGKTQFQLLATALTIFAAATCAFNLPLGAALIVSKDVAMCAVLTNQHREYVSIRSHMLTWIPLLAFSCLCLIIWA